MALITAQRARHALWLRGNISWKLHKGQEVIEKKYAKVHKKMFVGNCARRFGKSYWLIKTAVECALRCKNKLPRIKYASATVKQLEEYVIPSFESILEDCPTELWAGWGDGYVRSKKKFVFSNGAEIQLVGLDKDPDGGRGNYCDLYIIDESGYVDNLDYLYSSVIAPMTLTRPGARIILMGTPSSTPEHPFKEFCEKAQKQHAYVELNIHENPMMTPELISEARAECFTESDWLREYMCQHVVDETRAVTPEWKMDYEVDMARPDYFPHLDRYVSMDLGTKVDLTAVLYGWYDTRKKHLFVEAEDSITGPRMTTPDLKDMITSREAVIWTDGIAPYRRVADNDNPLLLQDLGYMHGLYFSATNKDNLHAMVNELRKMILEQRIFVSPSCKKLIACLRSAIWDKQRKGLSRSPALGHFDHLMALVYMVRNLDQSRDNIPTYEPGQEPDFLRETKKMEQNAVALETMLGFNRSKRGR